jgi:hypothetical protein
MDQMCFPLIVDIEDGLPKGLDPFLGNAQKILSYSESCNVIPCGGYPVAPFYLFEFGQAHKDKNAPIRGGRSSSSRSLGLIDLERLLAADQLVDYYCYEDPEIYLDPTGFYQFVPGLSQNYWYLILTLAPQEFFLLVVTTLNAHPQGSTVDKVWFDWYD